jgi:thiol-disulfide isomerase/thioredoxin
MSRLLLPLSLVFVLCCSALAEEQIPLGPPGATLEQVQNHPEDDKLLNKFAGTSFREINRLSDSDPDAAEKKLAEFEATLATLKPVGEKAETLHKRMQGTIKAYRDNIAMERLTLADVEQALTAKPDDAEAFRNWSSKFLGEVYGIAYSRPDEAEAKLTAAKEYLTKISEAAQADGTKSRIAALSGARGSFSQLEKAIAKGREYLPLIGKDAAPLTVKTWVNGTPLTAGDLQGKVVLLDFWAVWCGPCIVTFPHLREWQEKYGDKGLVVIGLTRYYKWNWDDEAGYAARPDGEEATAEQEQEMLQKFAAYYHLKHRFAIQEEGDSLDEYYGVSGIPHVVVLDKEGKIRMIRVGSGKQNAEDIDKLLAELLK